MPRSKEDPRESKPQDRARIRSARETSPTPSDRPGTARQPNPIPDPAPQSQSLFRSYGSNLLTSLTYINLLTRGSLPWRPAADMGTHRRDNSVWPSPGFSSSEGKIRTPPQLRCSSRSKSYLPARGLQGTRTLIQKRKLFPDVPTASQGHFWVTPTNTLSTARMVCDSAAKFRNRNRIPFRPTGVKCLVSNHILTPHLHRISLRA